MAFTVTERVPFEPIPFTYEGERATIIVPSKDVVGHGATATVLQGILYAATGVKLVALKVHGAILTDKQRLLLHREMEVWRKVVHPRILPFYGTCDISTNQVALVSPYMDKGNLCKYLADNEDCDRLQMIRQVAEGLHYLHKTGFVHGDIKCENVLVDPDGNAVIADFGLSTPVYSEDAPTATFIRERKTVKFSAPELFIDEAVDYGITLRARSKTRMSDVYAFGALIYQVYSGSPPWHGLNDRAVLLCVCRGERPDRPPHPHLRDEIWDLCLRCWKHIPGDRPFMFFVLRELAGLVAASEKQPALVTLNPDAPEFVPSFLPFAGGIYPLPERPASAPPEAVPNLVPSPITSDSDLTKENWPRYAKRPGQCRYASPFSGVACGQRLSRQEDLPRHIAKVHAREEAECVRDGHLQISTFDNASDNCSMSMGVSQGAILRRTRRDVDRQLQNFRSATASTVSLALTDQAPLLHDVGFGVQPGRTSSAMSSGPAAASSFSYDSRVVDYGPFEIDYAALGVPEANGVLAGSSDAGAAASCSASETMANVLPSASPLFSLNPLARSFTMPPDRNLCGTGSLNQDVRSDPSQSCPAKVEGGLSASASIFIPRFGFLTSPTRADSESVVSSSPPKSPEAKTLSPYGLSVRVFYTPSRLSLRVYDTLSDGSDPWHTPDFL